MALEALASNDLSNFIIYDTISATQHYHHGSSETNFLLDSFSNPHFNGASSSLNFLGNFDCSSTMMSRSSLAPDSVDGRSNPAATQGRKKRRRKPRVCKNKEEAETQRMTHINVERNRRKQMNDHLAVLRSLMPESYIQRGDQASIVGGAIDFVKELEQHLQSLEAQNRISKQPRGWGGGPHDLNNITTTNINNNNDKDTFALPPFAQFFAYPQYSWTQVPGEYPVENQLAVADIEVTMIETHANIRVLSKRRPRQLIRMIAGFQSLRLTILHLNVTTLETMVLYSISTKVEEGCQLASADDIAGAVHHILRIIQEEASLLSG